ncbi:hypothetical protein CRUP_005985, partial [Coryphaenoides rupestris]
MSIMREWISNMFKSTSVRSYSSRQDDGSKDETDMWENVISLKFKYDDFEMYWRNTFTVDLEGKFQKESALDQVEFYCSKMDELSKSHPNVAAVIEKCALEAVSTLCQNGQEGRLFTRN